MRQPAFIFSAALLLALAGGHTTARAADTPSPKAYTRIANPDTNTVQLQIALRKFVPAQNGGPAIWLAAVMHIGEPKYYKELQRFLEKQTVVLYEGVNADAHRHHTHDPIESSTNLTKAGTNGGFSLQSDLARALGLVFQLDAVDYDRTNFLNSDLSIAQIQRVMEEGRLSPGPGEKGGTNAAFDVLLQIMDGSSFLGSLIKSGLNFVADSPKLQAVAKLTMLEAIGHLNGNFADVQGLPPDWQKLIKVLIEARNKNLLEDLKEQLKQIPADGSVAVFYGAGHMDDLEQRVTTDLHYKPASEIWLPAFSVDVRETGLGPSEVEWMRNLIDQQMEQIQQQPKTIPNP